MKRIFFCLLTVSLLFISNRSNAQLFNFSITPNPQCFSPLPGATYTALAGVLAHAPSATDYSWTIQPAATFTVVPGLGAPNNSIIALTMPACGIYTITLSAFNNTLTPGFPVLVASVVQQATVYCPSSGSVIVSPTLVCRGSTVTFTGTGGTSYTWSNGAPNASVITVTAFSNTCLNYTATTAQGCTISPSSPGCFSVQAVNITVNPASQTICVGSPICLTATATAATGSSVTANTTTTGIQWYDPNNNAVPGCTTAAVNGIYTVVATHSGSAGVCTYSATSSVVTSTNISVSAAASPTAVCPTANVTLTAVSVQSVATSYTWTSPSGTIAGNPVVRNPSVVTVYTVNVNYFGCPGTTTVQVGMLSLTPTITPSRLTTCPNTSLALTVQPYSASSSYTFSAFGANGATLSPLTMTAGNVAVHTPTNNISIPGSNMLPIQYVVNGYSLGCTGSTTITINQHVMTPSLTALPIFASGNTSVCPNTQFTLSTLNTGAGTTYTFVSGYTVSPGNFTLSSPSNTMNFVEHTPALGTPTMPNTYTVVVDSAGCSGEASITIYPMSLNPTLSVSSASICPGTALTMTASGGATTQYSFYFAPTPTTTPASFSTGINNIVTHTPPSTSTLMTYSVSVDSAGCTGSATRTVGILDLGPTLTLTPSSPSICPGRTFTLTANGALNYTLFAPPSGNSVTPNPPSNNTFTDNPSSLGTGITYTLQGDSIGCKGQTTITIYEKKLYPTISSTHSLICAGQQLTITAGNVNIGTPPPSITSYTFYAGFSIISTTLGPNPFNTVVHSPTVNTTYAVRVDSAGCTGVLPFPTVNVQIRPNLVLAPLSSAASVCPGTSATLSVPGPTNSGTSGMTYTWTWSQSAGTGSMFPGPPYPAPSGSTSAVVYPVTNSTYSVNILDSLGCIGSTVINVSIDPLAQLPVILSSNGSTICAGQSVTLSATYTTATMGNVTFTWTPPNPPQPGTSLIVSPSVTTVYTVTGSNGLGCFGSNTIAVPVGQYPNANPPIVASHPAVCVGFTSTLTAFGANSYTWTGNTFTGSVIQQSISAGPGSYTVLMSNGGGCTALAVTSVSLAPPLQIHATAAGVGTTCIANNTPKFSKPVQLNATGAGSYVWFPYNPIYMTYSLGPQTTVRPPASTCYTVIGTTAVCSGTAQVCVNVIKQFTMNVVPPLPAICLGDSLKLNITNIDNSAVGAPSAFTYSWTEAANAPPISMSDYLVPSPVVYPQNTTTYTVEVVDTRSCISVPRLVTVTVLPRPITSIAIPTINSIPTNSLCYVGLNPGESNVTINLIGSNQNTNLQFGVVPTYTWISPYPAKYNSILTPVNNAGITVNAPLKSPSLVTYSLISGYNGIQGCKEIDTVSVRIVDCRPVRDLYFETAEQNDTICARTCITFINRTDTAAGGPQQVKWTFEGGNPATSTEQNPTVCYNLPNTYNVILQVSNQYPTVNAGGPTGSSRTKGYLNYIKVVDVPNVTIFAPGQQHSDTTIRVGQAVNLSGSGAKRYEWTPSYNITSLTEQNVTVNPFKTTQYILTGYNSKSCFSSDTVNVIVIEDCGEMYVPNAFTPNGDGNNDRLFVRGICLESMTFMIFNRWGEKVFETDNQTIGWDGTYKGELMNTGVFVFRLEGKTHDGKGYSLKGNITLLR
jgi:gliding motility-associated-like protein